MYLYQVDNAVTYTSEDLVLFRESPFAAWMERLTLENPHHGIPPDSGSDPPSNTTLRQDDLAETLRAEGKDVLLVDWEADEPQRRRITLEAMRQGADFVVNGQLALGPLSGSVNLLMRTSGYSELGDYLYIPCDTQAKTTLHSAFRLCFLADLLHSLQGQLPPQMLITRGGDLVALQTEDHIYHYRAVKHRFMEAMREFRKHRMPDPSESSHFGRWAECAREVLRQRALHKREDWQEEVQDGVQSEEPTLQQAVAGGEPRTVTNPPSPGNDTTRRILTPGAAPGAAVSSPGGQVPAGPTLAEQARMLAPASTTEACADMGGTVPGPVLQPGTNDRQCPGHDMSADAALQNLEFITSSRRGPEIGDRRRRQEPSWDDVPEEPAAVREPTLEWPDESADTAPPAKLQWPDEETVAADKPSEENDEVNFLPVEINEQEFATAEPGGPQMTGPVASEPLRASIDRDAVEPFDPDLPEVSEPLPLPEVEEISLDGSVLPSGWPPEDTEPAAPEAAEHLFVSEAPSPTLKPASTGERPGASGPPASEPGAGILALDTAEPENGAYPAVDSDSGPLASPPAGPVTAKPDLPVFGQDGAPEEKPGVNKPPREDSDEPGVCTPFSDTLVTSDSFED